MIEFFSTYSGVLDTWPIEPMSKAVPTWVRTARDDYVQNKDMRKSHIFRCSGIGDLYKTGYVVRAWHDFSVQATEHKMSVKTPSDHLDSIAVDIQHAEGIAKFLPRKPGASRNIIKCNTPWHVIAPCKFLMLPVAYADKTDFESCIGILEPSTSTEINVQLYWNKLDEIGTVKAGTPLCHLVPLSDKDYNYVVREATDKDKQWLEKRHYILNMSVVYNIQKMKNLFSRFWKK